MAYVNPGELRYRIRVVSPNRTLDSNDHYTVKPGAELSLHAAIRAVRAEDIIEDGAARARETLQFIVHWRTGLNTDMTIHWRGRTYQIESIDPTPFAGNYMRIRAVSYDVGVGS